jgi:hypothetical protein
MTAYRRNSAPRFFTKPNRTATLGIIQGARRYNAIRNLDDAARQRGVVTNSAGNHAQGVALAARLFGVPAVIVMPEHAPLTKITATRASAPKWYCRAQRLMMRGSPPARSKLNAI